MDATTYVDSPFGRPAREPGNRWAFTYYSPRGIPRSLELDLRVVKALSQADAALGTLAGLGALITDPSTLIGPYLTREAVASSRIEGTQASLSDVLRAEAAKDHGNHQGDVHEVLAYLRATALASELSATLPISQRMLLQVHEALLAGGRGNEKSPGEFRRSPVWVGGASATPETALFVPPLPDEVPALLADWEQFVNDESPELPDLIRAALMHYQFETIHPFLDGNGRMGRLMINIMLKDCGRLPHPLLYLSHFFETHRNSYYAALQGVRERGDIESWLVFFLKAVRDQANDAVERARRLVHLREEYRAAAGEGRDASLGTLVELLMGNPFVTVTSVVQALEVSRQGAVNILDRATAWGWLTELPRGGPGGRRHWLAHEVLRILEAPMVYGTSSA